MGYRNKQNGRDHVSEYLTEMFRMHGNDDERMVLSWNIYGQLKNIQRKNTIMELRLRVLIELRKKSGTFSTIGIYFLQNIRVKESVAAQTFTRCNCKGTWWILAISDREAFS